MYRRSDISLRLLEYYEGGTLDSRLVIERYSRLTIGYVHTHFCKHERCMAGSTRCCGRW